MSISINHIQNNLPSCTRCAETQKYIMDYLSKSETDTISGNKWTIYTVYDPDDNVIDDIEKLLMKYGYMAVNINYVDKDVDISHAYILCSTGQGYYIIDSYVNCRGPSIRPFDFSLFRACIILPSLEKWNDLWLSYETRKEYPHNDTGIYLNYSFYDRDTIRKVMLNGAECY